MRVLGDHHDLGQALGESGVKDAQPLGGAQGRDTGGPKVDRLSSGPHPAVFPQRPVEGDSRAPTRPLGPQEVPILAI